MILTYVTLLQTHSDSRQTPRQTQHVARTSFAVNRQSENRFWIGSNGKTLRYLENQNDSVQQKPL